MKWLTPSEAEKLLNGCRSEAQTLILSCDVDDLSSKLSATPRSLSTDEGNPWPANEWVGLIDERPVLVHQELPHEKYAPPAVTVLTPFPKTHHGVGEWSILHELKALPRPIRSTRPLFIQSHIASDDHVVCRPNVWGWHDAIYRAASDTEAKDLLHFLRESDSWNERCFVAKRPGAGEWTIHRQGRREQILGVYPDVDSALRLACKLSADSPDDVLVVKDRLGKRHPREYHVAHGHLKPAMG
jgi:hypothetical protein